MKLEPEVKPDRDSVSAIFDVNEDLDRKAKHAKDRRKQQREIANLTRRALKKANESPV